jgi:hypothetical protein
MTTVAQRVFVAVTPSCVDMRRLMALLIFGVGASRALGLQASLVEYMTSQQYGIVLLTCGMGLALTERYRLAWPGRLVAGLAAIVLAFLTADLWPIYTSVWLYGMFTLVLVSETMTST